MDVLAGLIVFFGVVGLSVGLVHWRLRRHNRVQPTIPSAAPLRWLVSPAPAARLHRRLQTTVRIAEARGGRQAPAVADVGAHAVDLDHRVVLAARRPLTDRWATLRALAAECDELERLTLAIEPVHRADAVGDPHERLTALAQARTEVESIDRRYLV